MPPVLFIGATAAAYVHESESLLEGSKEEHDIHLPTNINTVNYVDYVIPGDEGKQWIVVEFDQLDAQNFTYFTSILGGYGGRVLQLHSNSPFPVHCNSTFFGGGAPGAWFNPASRIDTAQRTYVHDGTDWALNGSWTPPPGPARMTFTTPTDAKPGDAMLAAIALAEDLLDVDTINGVAVADSGWTQIAVHDVAASWRLLVFRYTITVDDPSEFEFVFDAAGNQNCAGAALVYRGLADAAPLGSSAVAVSGSANFAAPSRVLTTWTDLYVGVAFASETQPTFTPPAGGRERFDEHEAERALAIWDYLHEGASATGVQTAIASAAANGFAASLALVADPVPVVKSIEYSVPGAIGLAGDGV